MKLATTTMKDGRHLLEINTDHSCYWVLTNGWMDGWMNRGERKVGGFHSCINCGRHCVSCLCVIVCVGTTPSGERHRRRPFILQCDTSHHQRIYIGRKKILESIERKPGEYQRILKNPREIQSSVTIRLLTEEKEQSPTKTDCNFPSKSHTEKMIVKKSIFNLYNSAHKS